MTLKSRARPMAAAERREQLLQTAREIVASDGLAGLTMEKLSARANVSKPVAYAIFGSRQDVAIALLEEHFETITEAFEQRVASATTLDTYIAAVVEAAFSFNSASKNSIEKIVNGFSTGDAVNRLYLEQQAAFTEHWGQLLRLLSAPPGVILSGAAILSGMVANAVRVSAPAEEAQTMETLKLMLLAGIDALTRGATAGPDSVSFEAPVYSLIKSLVQSNPPNAEDA